MPNAAYFSRIGRISASRAGRYGSGSGGVDVSLRFFPQGGSSNNRLSRISSLISALAGGPENPNDLGLRALSKSFSGRGAEEAISTAASAATARGSRIQKRDLGQAKIVASFSNCDLNSGFFFGGTLNGPVNWR